MKCPHCEKEIPVSPCSKCGAMVFEDANYCTACGATLNEDSKKTFRDAVLLEDDHGIDFEERVLCPDEACIGIIVDGLCTECGDEEERVAARKARERAFVEEFLAQHPGFNPETFDPRFDGELNVVKATCKRCRQHCEHLHFAKGWFYGRPGNTDASGVTHHYCCSGCEQQWEHVLAD